MGYRATVKGQQLAALPGLQPPVDLGDCPAEVKVARCRKKERTPSSAWRAPTSNWSVRWPPRSAVSASPSLTKARVCASWANRCAARRAKPQPVSGRQIRTRHGIQQIHPSIQDQAARTPQGARYPDTSAPVGLPQQQGHLRPDRRTTRKGRTLVSASQLEGQEGAWRRGHRTGQARGPCHRREGEGRRHHEGRVRSQRLPLPWPREGAGRCRTRGRPQF